MAMHEYKNFGPALAKCANDCGCIVDLFGYAGPKGIDPKGECPNSEIGEEKQQQN